MQGQSPPAYFPWGWKDGTQLLSDVFYFCVFIQCSPHMDYPTNKAAELTVLNALVQFSKTIMFICRLWANRWVSKWDNRSPLQVSKINFSVHECMHIPYG